MRGTSLLLMLACTAAPLHALRAASPLPAPPQNTSIEVRQLAPQVDASPFDMEMIPVRADPALDMWALRPPWTAPQVLAVSRVNPFDVFLPLVRLSGIGAGPDGKGHVSLDVSVVGVDGETDVLAEDLTAWDGAVPPPGFRVLNQSPAGVAFDDKEPCGALTLVVTAHDAVSGATVRREAAIELLPWTYGETPKDAQSAGDWWTHYFSGPRPGEAVRAYLECSPLENEGTRTWNVAVLGFYRAVFSGKPWLVDHLVSRVTDALPPEQLLKVCVMLHVLGQDERIDALPLPAAQRATVRKLLGDLVFDDPYAPIATSNQLDLLWGEFFATGRYAPFRQLVTAFRLAPFKDALDAYKDSAKTEADAEAARKGATFAAALWSIDSNLAQHPLLVDYGIWMLGREKLSTEESTLLGLLLAKHAPDRVRVRHKGDPDAWPGDAPVR